MARICVTFNGISRSEWKRARTNGHKEYGEEIDMSPERTCPDCGATLPADAPRGLCPDCLMRAALSQGSTGRWTATGAFEPTGSRVLAAISETIGPVPHVLLRDTAPGEVPGPIVVRPGDDDGDRSIRYRIDGEIARGGMGAILKGRDPDLGRDVALKVLRDDLRENAMMVRRFIEEAQIGGQLQHPGVVPIYELGTFADRRPFFAMKLVKGHTLSQLLDGRKDPAVDRPRFLAIFEAICQTVAYAHARGVIHRDLKPSNVMVGSFGEVQVMDWGLAKVLRRGGAFDDEKADKPDRAETVIATAGTSSDSPGLSQAGWVMGTPAHMAPEQARGEIELIDERADVFALGSILCDLLTGSAAFVGRSSGEIQRKAALGDTAEALGRLDACGADGELIAIAKDCLAREAEDRPRHAGVVAQQVTSYLAGVQERLRAAEVARAAESARAEEAIVRARAERRARQFQVGLAASLLLFTTAGGLTFTYWLQQRQERDAQFNQLLAGATALREKAERQPGDPAAWRDALAALARAEGQGPAERILALRRAIGAGLEKAERDARLRQQVVEIRANQEDVGREGTDAAYATAYRDAGLDLEALEPGEFARRLRQQGEAAVIELSAFLDDWSAVRRQAARPAAAWRRPLEAARRADPEPYRDRIRTILLAEDRKPQTETLKALARAPEAAELPAPTAVLLGNTLADVGQAEAAVALLRQAAGRHPGDVWVNHALAGALERLRPVARDEAVRYYTAARALRPETAHMLAHLLDQLGRGAEAEAVFRDLVDRRPENPRHLACLGHYLLKSGRSAQAAPIIDRAVDASREAIRLRPGDAWAHSILGIALSEQGKLPEAIAAYREAIRLRPDYPTYHRNLANALHQQGKLPEAVLLNPDDDAAHTKLGRALRGHDKVSEAIAEFRETIRLKPDDGPAHVNLGNILLERGKISEAIAAYREGTRLSPDVADAHYNLGNGLLAQDKLSDAIAEFREALRLEPNDAELRCILGDTLHRQGRLPDAIAEFREAIRLKPNYALAHRNLGRALRDYDKLSDAIAEFREALRLEPNDAELHSILGVGLHRQGKLPDAIAAFRESIRLKPDYALAHRNLGRTLSDHGKLPEAIAAFRETIRLNPGDAEAHGELGHVLSEHRKVPEAVTEFREAIRLNPDDADGHNCLGAILCDETNDYPGAEAEFRQAVRLRPNLAEAHSNLGNALRRQGKLPDAIAAYREAIRLKPDDARAHYSLGNALDDQGKTPDAISAYREAIRLKPDDARAHCSLGVILCDQRRDYAGAEAEFREAIRLEPNDAGVRYNLGNALRGQEKQLEAIAAYRDAIRLKPDHAEVHCNLGVLLQGQGQFREALASIRRGHELGSKQPGWRYPSAGWVHQAEQFAALEAHLPAVIRGERKPQDPAERIVFAEMAYKTKQFGASARLYAESFLSDAKLAEDPKTGNRYDAARAAALAGAGKGQDDPKPDDAARFKLRGQALDWLKADLIAWSKAMDSGDAGARRVVASRLRRWISDPDFASVRDRNASEKLPADEQRAWEALWKDVDALLNRH
jgi:serine/threonine-protein kinase